MLTTRLEEAEKALADQSSGEELILKQLASLTKANEAAKAADAAQRKLVASLTAQLKSSKHALKQAQMTSKRERERLQRINSELADAATSNARSAAAARKKLRDMEEQLTKVQNSHGEELARATQELKAQAGALASEKSQALAKVKHLEAHQERGTSELKALQSKLQDATNEVAILQQDLTDVRARAAENLHQDLQAEANRAREDAEESLRIAKRKEEDARDAERSARFAAEKQARLEQENLEQRQALEKAQLALADARRKQNDAECTAQALQASLTASDNDRKQWQAQMESSGRDAGHWSMTNATTGTSRVSHGGTGVSSSSMFGSAHGQAGSVATQNMISALTLRATPRGFVVPAPTQDDPTLTTDQRLHKPKPPARPPTASATDIIDCSSSIRAHGSAGSNSARRHLVPSASGASAPNLMIPSAATGYLTETIASWGQAFSVVSDVKCRRPTSARRRLAPSEVSERAIYRFFVPPP